jgi:hypothetical protein
MSNNRSPIARLSLRHDNVTYNILTIWPGRFPGTYDIGLDKPHGNNQAMGLFDALESWGQGKGFLGFSIESERERRDSPGRQRPAEDRARSNSDDFGDDLGF